MLDPSFDFSRIYAIKSAYFENLFLQMDATGVTDNMPPLGVEQGVVNARYELGARAQFRITPVSGTRVAAYVIQSVALPQAFLSMDTIGMDPDRPDISGGLVDCRLKAGPLEIFTIENPDNRTDVYTIGSLYFDNVFLRMGNEASQPSPHGGGIVNCRYNHYPWEHFKFVPVS